MPLAPFHPLIARWFRDRFGAATAVQERGWAAIAAGRHALLCAPTGSGKTLAAFLLGIDRLYRESLAGTLDERARLVYVSPLKALSNDIRKNLEEPLAELRALAEGEGVAFPELRLATRTGDTPQAERRSFAKRPPHIWITTPESLYILLTSESGRKGLAQASTVIVDEIHALADDKRGSHLALSLERLDALAGRKLQRVGLSATVSPIEEVGRFLVGAGQDCAIVETGRRRAYDLAIELPDTELGPIATQQVWDGVLGKVAEHAAAHRTTLVFVNTRRLVERVSHQLSARIGEEQVVAHHGSLSRAIRLKAEERLKGGQVRVCVASASLELGIDVGSIDLAVQIGSPRSVSVLLQRVGRAAHAVGLTPKGRLLPLTRDELVECAALVRLARRGELDRLSVPPWPLDVLAQQIVAMAAAEELDEDDLFARIRRAWPYRELDRARFEAVLDMLSRGFSGRRGRGSAFLVRDAVNRRIRARRGAGIAAVTSGGAIPDVADYDVVLEPEGTLVGRINEDFAIESLAGDVFLLGNNSYRIRRIESGRVRVEDARGQAPTIPFWLGEAPARTIELSQEVSAVREEVARLLPDRAAAARALAAEPGIGEGPAAQVVAYIEEGRRVLGVVPTCQRIVAERFFDESGGMQLVIHSPWGGRINRAWGLALRKRFCRSFDFELQASAQDDGINLSLGPQHSFPLGEVFAFLRARGVREVATQAVLPSPIFATRWRWTATRSLALLRHDRGRKVPAPLQRMRSDDLLAAIFPAQAGCQDNAPPGGDIELPDHPLVFETMRDCLEEALDVTGLEGLLLRIERGEVEVLARDTVQPSAFSHQILNAMPYAFLDDAPLEERRARAVQLRRALPEDERDLGRLDPEAVFAVSAEAWPRPRDRDELCDSLADLLFLPERVLVERFPPDARLWAEALEREGRARRLDGALVASEEHDRAAAALGGDEAGLAVALRGWAAAFGPFTVGEMSQALGVPAGRVAIACAALEAEGTLLRGSFRPESGEEWCDRRLLARIHRATVTRLRAEIEPVTTAAYLAFLVRWQMAHPEARGEGAAGLLQAVELLAGFEAPAGAWDSEILPLRVRGFDAAVLDRLCLGGELAWGRFAPRPAADEEAPARRGALTRTALVSFALRHDLPWLREGGGEPKLSSRGRLVLEHLRAAGAVFASEIAKACRLLPAELDDALGELVGAGLLTADGFSPLRRLARGAEARPRRERLTFARSRRFDAEGDGRWWLLERVEPAPPDAPAQRAAQLLRRYGVLTRELLARESAPPWRELVPVLRRAEARGEIRGGRFIASLGGEQYALPEAIEALREARRAGPDGSVVVVSAADPLNLAGILTPGPRVPAVLGTRLALRDGVAVAVADREGAVEGVAGADPAALAEARARLERTRVTPLRAAR